MPDLYDLLALLRAHAAFFGLLEDGLHYALGLRGALIYVYGEDAGLVLMMEVDPGRGLHDHGRPFLLMDDVAHRAVGVLLSGFVDEFAVGLQHPYGEFGI